MTSKLICVGALLLCFAGGAFAGCDSGYSIQTKSGDGSLLTLDDGSIWKVINGGEADSSIWIEGDEVLVCDDGTIINKDEDNEQVDVTLLSR